MTSFEAKLKELRSKKKIGLMTHVVVGYPSLSDTVHLVKTMAKAGVDFIELQIPFSDPLADGPTIMRACEEALKKGVKVEYAFKLASTLSQQVKIPLLFMAYYNTVFKYGTQKFCQDARRAGISGLIVPDIPLEEEREEHFIIYCKEAGLKNIRVVSPVSTVDRLKKNTKVADGFIYCTARQGITGTQKELDPQIAAFLKSVKRYFKIPIAVGFGISNKERIKLIKPFADIAIVGSAIIDVVNKSKRSELEKNVEHFINSLKMVD